jgi:tetrathionate reductase subunit B
MKSQLAMVIDAGKCWDCKGCLAACKVANQVPEDRWRNWVRSDGLEAAARAGKPTVFQPGGCMHCDQPSCVTACPTGATYKDPSDGRVVIDRELCIGCGQCVAACPYDARYRHPDLKVADKCDFCATRRAAGLEPACVSTCPTKARVFGDLGDPGSEVSRLLAENKDRVVRVVNDQCNTKPNMYYLGDPGPRDWPHPVQMPSAFRFFANWADPIVKVVVGLMGLGVAAMFLKQLVLRNDQPPEQEHKPEKGGHDE